MQSRDCWCGNSKLMEWGQGYWRCPACETLVAAAPGGGADPAVRDDATDFYGRNYWFGHQTQKLGCPDIVSRSRTDLAERCVHWMRSLLPYVLPPARVLEIGCAHGGFVAMLRQAGYDAMGLELSPAIVDLARNTFGVPVLTGLLEEWHLSAGTFDAVVLMDVVEHLPQPLPMLQRCVQLLKPNGVLLLQMPQYPAGQSLQQLMAAGHKFPQMLDPDEHLYLYSSQAAHQLMERAGARHVRLIPAIFDFYDQSLVASPWPLVEHLAAEIDAALEASVSARMVRALLDLDARRLNLLAKYRQLRDHPQRHAA